MGTSIRAQQRAATEPVGQPRRIPSPDAERARHAATRTPPGCAFDFSRVAVESERERADTRAKTSATGDPTIRFTYTPEPSNKSTKIVFIQTVQFKADGTAVKPGSLQASFAYRDADLTPTMWAVDYTNGEKDPYYNGDDAGLDGGVQGNATTTPAVNATMGDTPDWPDVLFPAGAKKVEETFVTASFSAAGADSGTFYDWIDWTYAHEKGKTGKITLGKGGTGTPGTDFTDSVSLWASHHKFVLPKVAAAPAPAPVPSPAPSPVPAPPPAAPPKK